MTDVVAPLDELLVGPQILFDIDALVLCYPGASQSDTTGSSAELSPLFDVTVLFQRVGPAAAEEAVVRMEFSWHCCVEVAFDDYMDRD